MMQKGARVRVLVRSFYKTTRHNMVGIGVILIGGILLGINAMVVSILTSEAAGSGYIHNIAGHTVKL